MISSEWRRLKKLVFGRNVERVFSSDGGNKNRFKKIHPNFNMAFGT